MSKTQTVQELLNQFNLRLNLPKLILDFEIEGEYTSFKIDKGSFFVENNEFHIDQFEYYQFEGDYYMCQIIPDNDDEIIGVFKMSGDEFPRAMGKMYNSLGQVVSIT